MSSPLTKSNIKRLGKITVKTTFISALLFFLFKKGFLSFSSTQQALQKWDFIIPTFFLYLGASFLAMIRWQILLRAQGMTLSWRQIFQLSLIGSFFNIALPGAISGDFVKAFYIGKLLHGQRSKALGSILFDRVAGMSALVLVSATALALGIEQFSHSEVLAGVQLFLGTAALCVLIFYTYLFLVQEKHDPILRFLNWVETHLPKTSSLKNVYNSLKYYHHHRIAVTQALIISIGIHLLVGLCCLRLIQALGDTTLSLLSAYLVVPLGLLVTAVPVAPAGVGTGNIAFLYLFHLLGSEQGGDMFSLLAIFNLLIGALGGLIYFRYKSGGHHLSINLDEMR